MEPTWSEAGELTSFVDTARMLEIEKTTFPSSYSQLIISSDVCELLPEVFAKRYSFEAKTILDRTGSKQIRVMGCDL